jgi:hypothetical protein
MATANLGLKLDSQTAQSHPAEAIEDHISGLDELVDPRPIPISGLRHLDVDAVLARSLPKVVSE